MKCFRTSRSVKRTIDTVSKASKKDAEAEEASTEMTSSRCSSVAAAEAHSVVEDALVVRDEARVRFMVNFEAHSCF